MYKILYIALNIFWGFDIINLSFMKMFDTTYPINTLAWFLIWVVVDGTRIITEFTQSNEQY